MNSARNQQEYTTSEATQSVIDNYANLNTDDKLALLYYIYKKMGDSITPAAPNAANPNLAPTLINDFLDLADDRQLAIMHEIVNCEDTEYSRSYGALTANNQLLVWFIWATEMGNRVVDLPNNYSQSQSVSEILSQVESLEFEQQISILREAVTNMGYSEVQEMPTQAETGVTPSL